MSDDLALLRTYEPIVRFTRGEQFFPMDADTYVRGASLWSRSPRGRVREQAPVGTLDLERLAAHADVPAGHRLWLRFVDEPLDAIEYAAWRARPERPRFEGRGRLARVPFLSRLLDAAFDLSLLARGRVPGGTAAAAEVKLRALDPEGRRVYYGRVVRESDWVVLQYLFFYPMNDWRSGFSGANDHEADWEQVLVYLHETADGLLEPRWVACASHDAHGPDLRRRWDDPTLRREGTHPVVFVAAGSHATYVEPGDYVMGVEPPALRPLRVALTWLRRVWAERLRQGAGEPEEDAEEAERADRRIARAISIPFVDYARGDGERVGPGQGREWSPVLLTGREPWVERYRGLWGLDTHDPFGGERAPAGPKYERDGRVRRSWHDPLGWAGLDREWPPSLLRAALAERRRALDADLAALEGAVAAQREVVRRVALDERALRTSAQRGALHPHAVTALAEAERELAALQERRSMVAETIAALGEWSARVALGDFGAPDAHLHRPFRPEPPPPPPHRAVELWAATSAAVALLVVAALVVLAPPGWVWWLTIVVLALGAIEAATRGRLERFLVNGVLGLAVLTTAVLVWEFWRLLLLAGIAIVVAVLVRDNLREVRRG